MIDDYKSSVQEIVILCERICDSPLVNIPQTEAYELKDLDNLMYEYRYYCSYNLSLLSYCGMKPKPNSWF